jgi:hypothetical protein
MSQIVSNPGFYDWYPSKGGSRWQGQFEGCSPYYIWFKELGYEQLDIREFDDGEWAIIEYYNSPVIPSLTRWNYVLQGLRNILITPGFITKYVKQLDLRQNEYWDQCEAKTKAMETEKDRLEAHAQDTAERAKNAIIQNPELVERIAKKGMNEISLSNIVKHIPRNKLIGGV